jgi:Ca2+-dependent lipid-binding protein
LTIGRTPTIRFKLSPEWNKEFRVSSLHLFHLLSFEIWDENVLSDRMLGKVEIKTEELPLNREIEYERFLQKGDSAIEPRGSLVFSLLIQVSIHLGVQLNIILKF